MRALRLASLLLLCLTGLAERDVFVPANDVSFTIETERHSYRVGELIVLQYRIVNISNASLYVPREWGTECPPKPHIWAWYEDSSGRHSIPGYAGDCFTTPHTMVERMRKEAVLLKPGERMRGHITLKTTVFSDLKPGPYRIETTLYGWSDQDFSQEQLSGLRKMADPLMRGEVPASVRVELTR